ncbi:hypothetical protein [uncultured Gimesia sp.]|uniref:hypothetical protein n=1 Tax=uncultured Gimesia sp. TaxID=1678688 RepID=UPI0030DD9792
MFAILLVDIATGMIATTKTHERMGRPECNSGLPGYLKVGAVPVCLPAWRDSTLYCRLDGTR